MREPITCLVLSDVFGPMASITFRVNCGSKRDVEGVDMMLVMEEDFSVFVLDLWKWQTRWYQEFSSSCYRLTSYMSEAVFGTLIIHALKSTKYSVRPWVRV